MTSPTRTIAHRDYYIRRGKFLCHVTLDCGHRFPVLAATEPPVGDMVELPCYECKMEADEEWYASQGDKQAG